MLRRTYSLAAALVVGTLLIAGCDGQDDTPKTRTGLDVPEPLKVGAVVKDYARPIGTGFLPVEGYGLVIGLGTKGSREVPGALKDRLTKYLSRNDIGSWRAETQDVSPMRVLKDLDTAIVIVRGQVPPGAPKGTRFDIHVEAMPRTNTTSLDGGILMPLDLHLASGNWNVARLDTKVWAKASGPMFVNPFLDPNNPQEKPLLRRGKVIGGAVTTDSRYIRLQLLKQDYSKAYLIQNRINARFPRRDKVAIARTGTLVDLKVPPRYRDDYARFVELVLHLPLEYDIEAQILRSTEAIQQPGADREEISTIWEAIGKQIVPHVQKLYHHRSPIVAYYAARTGLRLGDRTAAPVLVRFARTADSPVQIQSIDELGYHSKVYTALEALEGLLDDENQQVRLAAYEALIRRGDSTLVRRQRISGGFTLDTVRSHGDYVIYATQTRSPRIVIFGEELSIKQNVFYRSPDKMIMLNCSPREDKVTLRRKIPRTGGTSDPFEVERDVCEVVKTLGTLTSPDEYGEVHGLGLSYGQILTAVGQLCRRGDIPAKFILQRPEGVRQQYQGLPTLGRPDMPGY